MESLQREGPDAARIDAAAGKYAKRGRRMETDGHFDEERGRECMMQQLMNVK